MLHRPAFATVAQPQQADAGVGCRQLACSTGGGIGAAIINHQNLPGIRAATQEVDNLPESVGNV